MKFKAEMKVRTSLRNTFAVHLRVMVKSTQAVTAVPTNALYCPAGCPGTFAENEGGPIYAEKTTLPPTQPKEFFT